MFIIRLLCIFSICLFSQTYPANRSVFLLHNFLTPLEPDTVLTSPVYQPLINLLAAKKLTLTSANSIYYQTYFDSPSLAYIVFCNLPITFNFFQFQQQVPKAKLILFAWEPPTIQPWLYSNSAIAMFSKIYTWNDDLVDNKTFFKFYYPVFLSMRTDLIPFENRKLCTLINSNKTTPYPNELFSERARVIQFYETNHPADFTFYGYNWEGLGYTTYGGSPPDKIGTLLNYRFCICYENTQGLNGYITEKLFDCFAAGCIPIYLGACNVGQYIPINCFIDRRNFNSDEAIYTYIKNMSSEEYNCYLDNIKSFLSSPQASVFSKENFIKIFNEAIIIK